MQTIGNELHLDDALPDVEELDEFGKKKTKEQRKREQSK
jgi:hypothetical protein